MIPSRGLRWSSQAIGIGRRRVDALSARQFSSSVQHVPIRASPLLSKNGASSPRRLTNPQFSRINVLIRNGAGVRFASTTPIPSAAASTTPPVETPATPPDLPNDLDSAMDFSTASFYDIPEHIGYLKNLGLEYGWGPTSLMQWTLEHVHVFAGTPWWVSITLTAILVRGVLFIPYVRAADNQARMATIQHIIKPITEGMSAAGRVGDRATQMRLQGELKEITKKAGVKMWRSFVPMIQVVSGYGTFVLLRAMAKLPVPGLETGGILWFYNLTLPDPYWALPVATAGVLHWVLRRGGEMGASTATPAVQNAMMWGLPAISVCFTFWMPAALQLSFFVSGVLSYGQATLFRQPWFRSFFNMVPIPKPKSGPESIPSPYKGQIRVNPALSQAELTKRFQGAAPPKSKGNVESMVQKSDGTWTSIKEAAKTPINMGRKSLRERQEASTIRDKQTYEKKRSAQIKKEIEGREYNATLRREMMKERRGTVEKRAGR